MGGGWVVVCVCMSMVVVVVVVVVLAAAAAVDAKASPRVGGQASTAASSRCGCAVDRSLGILAAAAGGRAGMAWYGTGG